MRTLRERKFFFFFFFFLFSLAGGAEAHRPVAIGKELKNHDFSSARVLKDPDVSQVLYAELKNPGQVDFLSFAGKEGERITVQMGVPEIPRLLKFRPAVALIGPGLPPSSEKIPFFLPAGMGAKVLHFLPGDKVVFFEPFTRTSSWRSPTLKVTLSNDAKYYLAAFAPKGGRGKYWLAIGEKEEFGPGDWLRMPRTIWQVRRFHEIESWKDAMAALLFLLLGLLLYRIWLRR
ncbi:MAG TPA: hypothetical protein DD435_15890 [Cyanobacteria bacterium UBA8530]|nr:hypothetical protein [Cyanobacteria bacterium UBA8530]